MDSARPPTRSTARKIVLGAGSHEVEASEAQTAVTTFLASAQGEARHRHALHVLAQSAGTTEGFMYSCRGQALTLVAALEDALVPERLETHAAEVVARGHGADQYVIALADPNAESGDAAAIRFHMIVLTHPGTRQPLALIALRQGAGPLARLRSALLAEVTSALLAESSS
jgi:hypothetical protein